MAIFQIDGISGTGKTTVCEELIRRGYKAIDSDEAFGYYGDPKTGLPTDEKNQLNWIWDLDKVRKLAETSSEDTIFVCGGAMNQDEVKNLFEKKLTLIIDDATLRQRLIGRTNNTFGKHPDDLTRQLEWNKGAVDYAKRIGSIVIDGTNSIDVVVDEILRVTSSTTSK
jgi:uridine kinase